MWVCVVNVCMWVRVYVGACVCGCVVNRLCMHHRKEREGERVCVSAYVCVYTRERETQKHRECASDSVCVREIMCVREDP